MTSASTQQQLYNDDGTPRRKYEIEPQEESRAGVRIAVGLALASAFAVVKNVLFRNDATATPTSPKIAAAPDGAVREQELALADQENRQQPQGSDADEDPAHGSGTSLAFLTPRGSLEGQPYAPIDYARAQSHPPIPGNDNEALYGAAPGAAIDLASPSATRGGNPSPGSSAGAEPDDGSRNDDDDDDDDDGDDEPVRINRLPVISGPVVLADLVSNQSIILALSDLLRNASDPDGDALTVRDLKASSGMLMERADGSWMFTPETDDTSEVTFTYMVSDGTGEVQQVALLDLVPPQPVRIVGSSGSDTLVGTPGDDIVNAMDGDDIVLAREGNDVIYGGPGHDRLFGGDGNDVIYAGDGDDLVYGGAGDDVVFGGTGNDIIFGEDGDDRLFGEEGDDVVYGGDGNDVISGGDGNDRLFGEDGDDVIEGGAGDDHIEGGDGNDIFVAGSGNDVVSGGAGNDVFVALPGDGDDAYAGEEGIDTYDASATRADAVIDLLEGTASSSDIGTDTLSGIENVVGGSGNDIIVANEDVNILTGGPGNDIFVFRTSLSIGKGKGARDKILDFEVGDKIDLDDISKEFEKQIDAVFTDHGIKKFVLIGQQEEFSKPGQLRFRYEIIDDKPVTILEGNIDSDREAEFELELIGHHLLRDDDFQVRG